MPNHHLIIGNGAAGMSAAEEIRRREPSASITVVADEPYPLYSRPGLAYLLMGEIPEERIFCRKPEAYSEGTICLVHGTVAALDLVRHQAHLADGREIRFDTLLLATGASAVPAPFPGSKLDGVVYLDTLDNVKDILRRIRDGARAAVVVGGGITAMEMAEGLCRRGLEVHYLLRKKGLWSVLLNHEESSLVEQHARAMGIQIHFNEEIAEIHGACGRVTGVRTTGGEEIDCEMVGAGIGVRPNLRLAKEAQIRTDRGIIVDEFLETTVPGVFAAGDVAQVLDQWSGELRLDDLWSSAIAAGTLAGANMTGAREPYVKGAPFNAALLFGVHLAAIGQAGVGRSGEEDENETLRYQSRGSSEVWWARPGGPYSQAWNQGSDTSMRLVLRENLIVGALVLGNQDMTNPLRDLIGKRVDISPIRARLGTNDPTLGKAVRTFWERWRRGRLPWE